MCDENFNISRDINLNPPEFTIPIDRIGVSNIYLPSLHIKIGDWSTSTIVKVSAYVDLPKTYKGIHASRSYESITDVFSNYIGMKIKIEDFCNDISKRLLVRHDYSSNSVVYAEAPLIYIDKTPLDRESYERAYLLGKAYAKRVSDRIKTRKFLGIKAVGITACPSAKRSIYIEFLERLSRLDSQIYKNIVKYKEEIDQILPIATHMQRAYIKIFMEIPENYDVNALDLLKIVKTAASSPTYEYLKKDDETLVILNALNNPKFVEDVIRDIARSIIERYNDFPDNTQLYIRVKSIESIHQHDLSGTLKTNFIELRKTFSSRSRDNV